VDQFTRQSWSCTLYHTPLLVPFWWCCYSETALHRRFLRTSLSITTHAFRTPAYDTSNLTTTPLAHHTHTIHTSERSSGTEQRDTYSPTDRFPNLALLPPSSTTMAANDYYTTPHGANTHAHAPQSPLSPLPSNHPHTHSSPFDDDNNYYTTPNSSGALGAYPSPTSYQGAQQDPFTDHNAIPMHVQPKADGHGSGKLDHDGSPTRYGSDPEVGGRRRKSKKKKKGLFNGRVTWMCYVLTVVQVAVFVGELIKNGEIYSSMLAPAFSEGIVHANIVTQAS